jgi:hypothetical protein
MSIQFGQGVVSVSLDWTTFKDVVISKNLEMQYVDDGTTLVVFAFKGTLVYSTTLWVGVVPDGVINSGYSQLQNDTDKADFNDNYKDVLNPWATGANAVITTSYSPDVSNNVESNSTLQVDASNRLETHSAITTDEGSYRDDFIGTSLSSSLSGLVTFTSGSTSVTGVGTSFISEVLAYSYVKDGLCPECCFTQVETVENDTTLTLVEPYPGSPPPDGSGFITFWKTATPVSGSIIVLNSTASVNVGLTSGAFGYICKVGDYGPFTLNVNASISRRIANQTAVIGFMDDFASPTKQSVVRFTGTNSSSVDFVTSFGASTHNAQVTTITLPMGVATNVNNLYKIDVSGNQASLMINGVLLAVHNLHIPGPYDSLNVYAGITNTTAVTSSTSLNIDSVYFYNVDRLQIDNDFAGEPIRVTSITKPQYGLSNQPVTITLASLANGSARASTAINNSATLYEDVYFFVKVTTAASSVSSTGYVNVYGYGSVDGGVTYPEGITGTNSAPTLSNPPNLVLLAQVNANANSKTFTAGPFSFCRLYGLDRLPQRWGLVVRNNTGAALNSTAGNHAITYQGVNGSFGTNAQTLV